MSNPVAAGNRPAAPLRGSDNTERLLRGGHAYVADHVRPDHAWGRVVRSPVASGRLASLDTTAARTVPGVLDIVVADDLGPPVPVIPLRNRTDATEVLQQPVLATERVRYVGEPVAFVVAEEPHIAEDAADLVRVTIDAEAAVTSPGQRAESRDDRGDGSGTLAELRLRNGDVEESFAQADVVVSGRYSVQRMTGMPMEPRGLIAEWEADGRPPVMHLWGPTKYIFFTRNSVAAMLGLAPEQVVVHSVDVGGMFGVRGEFYPEDFLVPWSARRLGRGVAWVEDRREHLLSINHSREQVHDYELALTEHGDFLAFRDVATIDAGAYSRPIGHRQTVIVAHDLPGPYRWQAIDINTRSVTTNKVPVGNMRGPGGTEAGFVRERAIDRAAQALGMDPIELRRRNLVPAQDLPYRIEFRGPHPDAITYDSGDYRATLDQFLERVDVSQVRRDIASRRESGELVGLGLALFLEHSGTGRSETVNAELGEDGTLTVNTGACEIGQGLTEFILRVANQELGIGKTRVRTLSGDTRTGVDARGTFGSRTAIFVGNAIADAMGSIRREAIARAADILGRRPDDILVDEDGLSAGDDHLHWKEVAPLLATGTYEGELTWGFGGHLAVVAIDRGTLDVDIERLALVYDCGRIINPEAVHGQLLGGAVFGLGGALLEEIPYDPQGQPQTTSLMDYLLPSCLDVPDVDVLAVEAAPTPGNTLGLKGAGEAGVLGVAGAVANAVADALGSVAGDSLVRLPLRPDYLLEALGDAGLEGSIDD